MNYLSEEFALQVFMASLFSSVIIYGVLTQLRKIGSHYKVNFNNPLIAVCLTYISGYLCSLYFGISVLWTFLLTGFIVGCLSTALYASVVKSLLTIVPRLLDRVLGKGDE